MTETITLTLTRDEAFALYELADIGMERFVSDPRWRGRYEQQDWNMDVAGSVCDKLAKAAYGDMSPPTWSEALARKAT